MSDTDESAFEPLSAEERLCLEAFVSRRVQFVVVGGYAVRCHGHLRTVSDLDLLIDTDEANLRALKVALADLDVKDVETVVQLFRSQPKCRWPWRDAGRKHYVDLISGICGWPYADVEADSVSVLHEGLALRVLSRSRVIADKRAMASDPSRVEKAAQDIEDLRYLVEERAVEQGDEADER